MKRLFLALGLAVLLLGAARPASAQAQWNVYVYMNAQPDLDEYALKDIEEMKLAGASPDVNVFVQLALSDRQVRRYRLQHRGAVLVDTLGAIDPFDSRNLADFVVWASERFPARKHCVIVWGHGTALPRVAALPGAAGLVGEPVATTAPRGIELRLLRESALRIRRALGRRVDVWGYDSCFMQRVEVGYELRGASRYLVASQAPVDSTGWDYAAWLNLLLDHPSMDGAELGRTLARVASESPTGETRPVACVDLTRFRALAEAISAFGAELGRLSADRGHRASIVTAHYRSRRYVGEDGQASAYLDLEDLAAHFTSSEFPAALVLAAEDVRAAVAAAVVLRFGDARSSGISIYHQIRPQMNAEYRSLDFCRATRWDEYLLGEAGPAGHRREGKMYRTRVGEPIPDADPAGLTSVLAVDEPGTVRSVRLFLDIRHAYAGDLLVVLVAPSGRQAVVLSRAGGNASSIRGWVDSEEVSELFRGEPASGDWQLRVADLSAQDLGQLVSWRLELLAERPGASARPAPAGWGG